MAFKRVRKIGNGYYLYEEHRWREDGKVKSKSIFLSVVGGFLNALIPSPSGSSTPPAELDRSVIGHASETADMAQGAAVVEAREAAAPSTFSQSNFLAETQAPAEAPAADASAADVGTAEGATGDAEGSGE